MTEALASEKSKKIEHVCIEEDMDIGEDMPTHNFPPVEIEKESSSSGGSSCSDSDSSSGSDTSSDSDSAVVLNYGNIFRFMRATLWSRLPFTLLSDEGDKIRKEWGVPSDLFGVLRPGRQTYALDKKGVVKVMPVTSE
ncbi:hypothetical protein IFM89_011079 [Coptis chinensis]|uniref:Uncharacterized protein n=1 Tax=Coptis chinensis TaxID=261450 RepID=A0A835IN49_9MAGN|nr:hypothetical protein IFM89_011079 [Coptis chinensis]